MFFLLLDLVLIVPILSEARLNVIVATKHIKPDPEVYSFKLVPCIVLHIEYIHPMNPTQSGKSILLSLAKN